MIDILFITFELGLVLTWMRINLVSVGRTCNGNGFAWQMSKVAGDTRQPGTRLELYLFVFFVPSSVSGDGELVTIELHRLVTVDLENLEEVAGLQWLELYRYRFPDV